MNAQFCRVGRKTPNLTRVFSLGDLKRQYLNFVEEAYNVMQSDMSLSDALYFEASRLKRHILNLENSSLKDADVIP